MTITIFQPGVEVQELHSNIIDQDFQLYIKLPWYYERSDTTYPVLFCLDGNRSFPMYSTMSLIYETPGTNAKEIVIVGVGYKVDEDRLRGLVQWAAWRTRDLTPVHRQTTEQYWNEKLSALSGGEDVEVNSGGAAPFLQSLREEIIPFIETNYRVSKTDRGLAGYSYGGLFALYTLFHAPEMFMRYLAGSPTMWDQLFEYEEKYASTNSDLKAQLFLTSGSNEVDLLEPLQQMVERLQSRNYPSLKMLFHMFEGEGHSSAYAACVSRALCMLYYENGMND